MCRGQDAVSSWKMSFTVGNAQTVALHVEAIAGCLRMVVLSASRTRYPPSVGALSLKAGITGINRRQSIGFFAEYRLKGLGTSPATRGGWPKRLKLKEVRICKAEQLLWGGDRGQINGE